MRHFYSPPRSVAHAENGMAATSHPHATLAALDCLRAGGTAMDAAVTAAAVLATVEPMSTGIGGDVFCLYAPKGSAEIIAYNGSGRAPAKAETTWFLENGITSIDASTAHAVTVPGTIEAWCRLTADHGVKGMDEILAPAIGYAEDGYTIQPVIGDAWQACAPRLRGDDNARSILLVDDEAPAVGALHRQPLLAKTMREVAAKGAAGFYEGWVAEDMVGYLEGLGGFHTLDDFAGAAGEYVTPIAIDYGSYRVHECPPNGQGVIALLMMNILNGYDIAAMDPLGAERLHVTLEAGRLAFRDRAAYVADPAMAEVPVETLLSDGYAAMLRGQIDPTRAMVDVPPPSLPKHKDTIYLTVVDKDRNAASFINSLYFGFGSGRVAPKSGVCLQNRGSGFVIDPGHPNCVAPGKRPMHTIIPAMLTAGEHAVMPFGVMGGDYQPWGHTHFLQNVLDYGMDVQAALDLPRFMDESGVAALEAGVPGPTAQALAGMGHPVAIAADDFGGGQGIWIDWERGILAGGTEPRKDGIAMGY